MVMGTATIERQPEPERDVKLLRLPEVADRIGLGQAKTWDLIADGTIESVKIGRARRVPDVAVDHYIAKLRAEAEADRAARADSAA
jgi:excisionase family DNA binding protein